MRLKISDIIDKHKGQKCIIVGHGPSLNPYLGKLKELKEQGYIIIGCNNWIEFYENCPPHYWLSANNVDHSGNLTQYINKYKPVWIYADTVDLTDYAWIDANFQTDYLPFDQRHFGGQKCGVCGWYKCDKNLDPNRLTIQEELQKYTGFDKRYNSGDTIAVHMFAFGILMGFSEVYVIGFDFNYHLGYAKNTTGRQIGDVCTYFDENSYGANVLKDVSVIAESAQKIGTKMYNMDKNSYWKYFEYKELI